MEISFDIFLHKFSVCHFFDNAFHCHILFCLYQLLGQRSNLLVALQGLHPHIIWEMNMSLIVGFVHNVVIMLEVLNVGMGFGLLFVNVVVIVDTN